MKQMGMERECYLLWCEGGMQPRAELRAYRLSHPARTAEAPADPDFEEKEKEKGNRNQDSTTPPAVAAASLPPLKTKASRRMSPISCDIQ